MTLSCMIANHCKGMITDYINDLIQSKNKEEFYENRRNLREHISYAKLNLDQLQTIEKQLSDIKGELESSFSEYESLNAIGWSTIQTPFSMILGHLFFPVQFEYLTEGSSSLITRETLQIRIAISASYGHILAQFYCAQILELYSDQEDSSETNNVILQYFGAEANQIHDLCLTIPNDYSLPSYLCGLYCTVRHTLSVALAHFKKGWESRDAWCRHRYVLLVRNETKRQEILAFHALHKENLDLALEELLHARTSDTDSRIKHYLKAGEFGHPHGYHSAALLSKANGELESALRLFLLAGQHHHIEAYEEIASDFINKGNFTEVKRIYEIMDASGDSTGLIRLGKIYEKTGFREEAKALYERTGLRGLEELYRLAESDSELINALERCSDYMRQRKNELLGLSRPHIC